MDPSGFESAFDYARQCNENPGRDYDRGLEPECYPGIDDPLYGTGIFYKSYEEEEND